METHVINKNNGNLVKFNNSQDAYDYINTLRLTIVGGFKNFNGINYIEVEE